MEPITTFENQNLIQPIPQPPQKNIFKILFFIFFCLFLVVSTYLVTIYLSQNKKTNSPLIQNQSNILPTTIPTQTVIDSIENWNLFVNENEGYSIKYPNVFTVETNKPDFPGSVVISGIDKTPKITIETKVLSPSKEINARILDVEAFRREESSTNQSPRNVQYFFTKNNINFAITMIGRSTNDELSEKIINTIKFN